MLSNLKRKADTAAASASSSASASASESNKDSSTKRSKAETTPKGSALDSKGQHKNTKTKQSTRKPFPKKKVKKIFLVCPPNVQTGGPEAMHQLCNEINIIGTQKSDCEVSAFMLYMQEKRGQACHVKNAMPLSAYSSI